MPSRYANLFPSPFIGPIAPLIAKPCAVCGWVSPEDVQRDAMIVDAELQALLHGIRLAKIIQRSEAARSIRTVHPDDTPAGPPSPAPSDGAFSVALSSLAPHSAVADFALDGTCLVNNEGRCAMASPPPRAPWYQLFAFAEPQSALGLYLSTIDESSNAPAWDEEPMTTSIMSPTWRSIFGSPLQCSRVTERKFR